MKYYFAPLEGITGHIFRNAHRKHFPGVDKYFTPFITTNQNHRFSNREMRDIFPENNQNINLVPQFLGKVAEEFVQAARVAGEMGYREINLNLGCPSGTVTAKGKGAGALAEPEKLDAYLDGIFGKVGILVSVKTRLGIRSAEEFGEILRIFNAYPICELTIHPRVQKDFYKNEPRLEAFERALKESENPVCYNGDINSKSSAAKLTGRFPGVSAVMIGRGLVRNPSLINEIKGGIPADIKGLKAFHDEVYEGYRREFRNERNAMMRMKEIWSYMIGIFDDSEEYSKKILRTSRPAEFDFLVKSVFEELKIKSQ